MKQLFSLVLLLMAVFTLKAQGPQPQQLPLDPAVKHGVLPNGLTYYILHNEEPKNRANFYIAQKVGSTLETPDQLGLAHFLEHMAFNGTTTYPGKDLLNYLQSKGIRFGADINAYTSFDETVYNIDNVPTNDVQLMDSVLLALRDWSSSILLEESEINAERGVIREEWRSRNSAQVRMYEAMLPQIFQEYQYQQMPIGKIDIIMNFKPEVLRAYYKKWYRPDQQGIIIVGDFDAAEMEKKVVDLFSKIPMPENAAERTYPVISDNEKPIYYAFSDKELPNSMITVSFKSEKFPLELRNTDQGYLFADLVPVMLSSMINERLSDYAQEADCPYAYAGVRIGNFYVAKTKDSFNIYIIPKDNVSPEKAYSAALAVVARACKTGFLTSEAERARDKILANLEKAYNERNKTQNSALAQEFINNFIDSKPAPGIENKRMLATMFLNSIPVDLYNQIAGTLMTPNNQVIVVSVPEGKEILSEAASVQLLTDAMNAQYEAYQEEAITAPLIAKQPVAGTIKSEKYTAEFG
ncbi:MAG: insulinase family protein, partial [Muribaculaceae bacterium]|nr:insulinase family protein [Muribaculaceae bacterium]